jgi:FkbM family methyltransferase
MLKKLARKLIKNRSYKIGSYKIQIPTSSKLPKNQKAHPLYDRFLPVLAKNLRAEGVIIDVGANVGDTLAAMIGQGDNSFVCIEPSDFFYKYLKKNTQNLNLKTAQSVKLVQTLVGVGNFSGALQHNGSTANVVLDDQSSQSNLKYARLDDIIPSDANVILLKSDVDGFDFDVIQSAERILSESEPVLFFENQIDAEFQYAGFDNLYDFLQKLGYKNIYIFDNFGNIVVENSDYHTLRNINAYLYTMKKYHTTRTFAYTDILAAPDKRLPIVNRAVDDYKRNWIRK